MSEVRFASDLHLGHKLAAVTRGFSKVTREEYFSGERGHRNRITQEELKEHDEVVIDSLATGSDKRTVTWILGDVCMNKKLMCMLDDIQGRKIMVRGNHDKFHINQYLKYFEDIHGIIKKYNFWLSHCPIHPQEMYRCHGNIHGHIHKNTNSSEIPLPYYNVNWDYVRGYKTLEEIRAAFDVEKPSQ